jgi:hypothetical protein
MIPNSSSSSSSPPFAPLPDSRAGVPDNSAASVRAAGRVDISEPGTSTARGHGQSPDLDALFAAPQARPVRRVSCGHRIGHQALMATSPTSTYGVLIASLLKFAAIQSLAIWVDASAPAWSS